ncbi:MAG: SurA N-terminal domain-containing protein, partial [Deltaproteobacteria bacterium]|nr:SurA N-terminal domain-containing protein [Deltaproteobacteria bacterium]
MRRKKLKLFVMFLFLAVFLAVGVLAFQNHYKRQLWDPETAATVNGRPILRSAVEQVMELANQPNLTLTSEDPGHVNVRQILSRLIDEELVRQAAQKEGVTVSPEQIEARLSLYSKSWGCDGSKARTLCHAPKGQSLEDLKQAIEKQILFDAMYRKVAMLHARPNREDWIPFWKAWLRKFPLTNVYRAQVLLVQNEKAAEALLKPSKKSRTLYDMAQAAKEAGYAVIVTEPMYLNPLDRTTFSLFKDTNLSQELLKASQRESRQTPPIRLKDSIAVFQVIESVKPIDAE